MSYLPLDIYTLILDDLDQVKDVDTLRCLSRCCSDLRPLSQRKLFHTIDLNYTTSTAKFQNHIIRLNAVLESSPCIADYVRSFKLQYFPPEIITPAHSSLIAGLGRILSGLHHVKAFSWHAFGISTFVDWVSFCANDGCQGFSQAILGILPSLTCLKIINIAWFPYDVMISRNVMLDVSEYRSRITSLTAVPDNNCDRRNTKNPTPPPRIRNYAIGSVWWPRKLEESWIEGVRCLHSANSPLPPFDFTHLQTLQVTWQGKESQPVTDTEGIMKCASTLKEFTCIGAQLTCTHPYLTSKADSAS